MADTVLDQGTRMNCGVWATMGILLKYDVQVDLVRFQDVKAITIGQIETLFVAGGLIQQFVKIPTPKLVDLWLKKGEWLITKTSTGNFANPINVTFDGDAVHFFIIKEDCGTKWKCRNSWGAGWGENGDFYIDKSEFKSLFLPRRIVTNKIGANK